MIGNKLVYERMRSFLRLPTSSDGLPPHRKLQKDPPKPTNPDVEITTYPKTTRFVKVFGGFATDGERA